MAIITNDLLTVITQNIYTNNNREVTADRLRTVLFELAEILDEVNTEFTSSMTVAELRANTVANIKSVFIRDVGKYGMFILVDSAGRTDDGGVTCIKDAFGLEYVRVQDPYGGLTTPVLNALSLRAAKSTTINGKNLETNITLTKSDIGLGNVDNTPDASKPISTATQTALNTLSSSIATKQNNIVAGTTAQYYRGDKQFVNFPTIPSTTNDLINNSGFVTSSSITSFTNKTGNISMWANDAGYLTSINNLQAVSNLSLVSGSTFFRTTASGSLYTPVSGSLSTGIQLVLATDNQNRRQIAFGGNDLYKKYWNNNVSGSWYKLLDEENYSPIITTFVSNSIIANALTIGSPQTITGTKTFSSASLFTDTWANYQAIFGNTGEGGRVKFINSANGELITIGALSQASTTGSISSSVELNVAATNKLTLTSTGTSTEISNTSTTGYLKLISTGTTDGSIRFQNRSTDSGRAFGTGNWQIGGGNTPTDNGYKFEVVGSFRAASGSFTGQVDITGSTLFAGNTLNLSGAGHLLYNTSDLTNYERVTQAWTGNVFDLYTTAAGTGTTRSLRIGTAASGGGNISRYMQIAPTGNAIAFNGSPNTAFPFVVIAPSINTSSGNNVVLDIVPSFTQTSTAGFTGIRFSPLLSTTGSGTKLLFDLGTNSATGGTGTHTSLFNISSTGVVTVGGDIVGDVNNSRNLGSSGVRFNTLFASNVSKGVNTNSFNLLSSASDVYFRSQPTTNNIVIQVSGSAPADNNYRLSVLGAGASAGALYVDGGISTFNGTITSTQFRLSALNTAPSSAADTGTTGEIRITNGFVYVCVASNTWQRVALATW